MPGSGSAPSFEASKAREILLALLEPAYGSAEDARAALERALQQAHRGELPTSVAEMIAFVRTALVPVLSEDLGPRLTMAVLDDFIAEYEIRSGVRRSQPLPSSPAPLGRIALRSRGSTKDHCPRVMLVDGDRVRRPALARALLREGCMVTVVDSLEQLGEVARSGEPLDVAILDAQHPAKLLFMEVIVDRFPGIPLVVRSAGEPATRALLESLGVARFEVLPGEASSEALVDSVVRIAAGTREPG